MTRGLGYVPDPSGHLKTSFDHHKRLLSVVIPLDADVSRFSPVGPGGTRHFDQNGCGACGGHSTAGTVYTVFAAAGRVLSFVPSPQFNYTVARRLDRVRNSDGSWPLLTDSGSQPNQLFRGMSAYGVKPLSPLPDRFSDSDPATVNDDVQLDEVEDSLVTLIVGAWAITSVGKQRSDDVARALAAGYDLDVAINGGCDAFQKFRGGGVLTGALLAGELDHYVRLSGFRTNALGKREFKIVNSWGDLASGSDWGEDGDVWIDETALDTLGDIYVVTPTKG